MALTSSLGRMVWLSVDLSLVKAFTIGGGESEVRFSVTRRHWGMALRKHVFPKLVIPLGLSPVSQSPPSSEALEVTCLAGDGTCSAPGLADGHLAFLCFRSVFLVTVWAVRSTAGALSVR